MDSTGVGESSNKELPELKYELWSAVRPDPAKVENYFMQIKAYEGFVDDCEVPIYGQITPAPPDVNQCVQDAAAFAVEEYNRNEGKVKSVVKVNLQNVAGFNFFLTIEASDGCFYEAKVYYCPWISNMLYFFRPAKYYPNLQG